jgi:hypothetical protein
MLNFESTALILSTQRREMGGAHATHGVRRDAEGMLEQGVRMLT